MLAAILGLSDLALTGDECALFRAADPAGYILFGRNIADKNQVRTLTDSLREVSGRADVPILIDQEGGRVARLRPPVWPEFPAGARFAALYEKAPISAIEAARANAEALAIILAEIGVNVNCLPLLDVPQPGAHDIIGDRALGNEPMGVAALGRAVLDGLAAGGVCGIVKHAPGHGRASADSHEQLPVVDATEEELATDIAPFRALSDAPIAMTAHVLYTAWDAQRPGTLSRVVISHIIREQIGFEGLVISDDLGMRALPGSLAERTQAALGAGCDVALHCSGRLEDNDALASAAGTISEVGRDRLARAMGMIAGKVSARSYEALAAKRDALLAYA